MTIAAESTHFEAASVEVAALAPRTAIEGPWRSGAFTALARHGVLAEFVPGDAGGTGAPERALVHGLVNIAQRCLTTALALSQWAAAVRIIAGGPPSWRARLPRLAHGAESTTVGISHLTTSRQHGPTPALVATPEGGAWRLTGFCPWVTGADSVDTIVTGATTADGTRAFFVVPTSTRGLTIGPPLDMLALTGSRTAEVQFADVLVTETMSPGAEGPRTGGLATTALALGATRAALSLMDTEARSRPALLRIAAALAAEAADLDARLESAASGGIEAADRERLRADANGLVVRAAHAALTAAKGAGFVRGHPAERLARESLFFLVWSCPPAVSGAVLCELAGLG